MNIETSNNAKRNHVLLILQAARENHPKLVRLVRNICKDLLRRRRRMHMRLANLGLTMGPGM